MSLGGDQPIPTGSWTQISLGSTENNADGLQDDANDQIVIEEHGYYIIAYGILVEPLSDQTQLQGRVNAGGHTLGQDHDDVSGSNSASVGATIPMIELFPGDTVSIQAKHNEGADTTAVSGTQFTWCGVFRRA